MVPTYCSTDQQLELRRTHGEVEASRRQNSKTTENRRGLSQVQEQVPVNPGSLSCQVGGPGKATSSFTDSASSSGKWDCAQKPGTGHKKSVQEQGMARPLSSCASMLASTVSSESAPITEAGPCSPKAVSPLAALPLRHTA